MDHRLRRWPADRPGARLGRLPHPLRILAVAAATAACLSGLPHLSLAQSSVITGHVMIGGQHVIDPPADDPTDSHAYLAIEGPAALIIYDAMRGPEQEDWCRGDWKMKVAGNFMCSITPDREDAICDFSISLLDGMVDAGLPC